MAERYRGANGCETEGNQWLANRGEPVAWRERRANG
jgi:hypothetical protein